MKQMNAIARRTLFALAACTAAIPAEGAADVFHTQRFPNEGLGYLSQFDAEEMASRVEEIYVNDKTISHFTVRVDEEKEGRKVGNLYPYGYTLRYRVVGQYFKA